MFKTVEATIEPNGKIQLVDPIHVAHVCRAIVTIIEEPDISETALLSQQALAKDWERPEEEEAWSYLQ